MITYGNKNLEEIIEKNLNEGNEYIIGLAIEVVVKFPNVRDCMFFVIDKIKKPNYNNQDIKPNYYKIWVENTIENEIEKLEKRINSSKVISVSNNRSELSKKLINTDFIQETYISVYDPNN